MEVGIRLGQTIHEVQGRNRIGLEGRRVKRGFAGPIPASEERLAGREGAEGNGMVHERFVEDDDVGDDFVKDAARAAAKRGQALAVDAGDDKRRMTSHEPADGFRVLFEKVVRSGDQHERIEARGVDLGLTVFRRDFQAQRAGLTAKLVLADDAETWQELDAVASRQLRRSEAGESIGWVEDETGRTRPGRRDGCSARV